MEIDRKLKKIGNSFGIIIPAPILRLLKINKNTKLTLIIKSNKMIIDIKKED